MAGDQGGDGVSEDADTGEYGGNVPQSLGHAAAKVLTSPYPTEAMVITFMCSVTRNPQPSRSMQPTVPTTIMGVSSTAARRTRGRASRGPVAPPETGSFCLKRSESAATDSFYEVRSWNEGNRCYGAFQLITWVLSLHPGGAPEELADLLQPRDPTPRPSGDTGLLTACSIGPVRSLDSGGRSSYGPRCLHRPSPDIPSTGAALRPYPVCG